MCGCRSFMWFTIWERDGRDDGGMVNMEAQPSRLPSICGAAPAWQQQQQFRQLRGIAAGRRMQREACVA